MLHLPTLLPRRHPSQAGPPVWWQKWPSGSSPTFLGTCDGKTIHVLKASLKAVSHWLSLSHMRIPEPITGRGWEGSGLSRPSAVGWEADRSPDGELTQGSCRKTEMPIPKGEVEAGQAGAAHAHPTCPPHTHPPSGSSLELKRPYPEPLALGTGPALLADFRPSAPTGSESLSHIAPRAPGCCKWLGPEPRWSYTSLHSLFPSFRLGPS